MKLGKYLIRPSALALMTLVMVSGTAIGALRIGTDNGETLAGTNSADQVTGKGGDDTLRGLAGNDVYHFKDCWGDDTVVERARHNVTIRRNGKKRTKWISGGRDTLNFSQHPYPVFIRLMPEVSRTDNRVISSCGSSANIGVELGTSPVENAVGGNNADKIEGGRVTNILQPGGGGNDQLIDYGGYTFIDTDIPVSNDTYRGFATNTGTDAIVDWDGDGDVLDLRPFASTGIYIDSFNSDSDLEEESLLIVTGVDGTTPIGVVIVGHFGEHGNYTSAYNQHGRIETLVFADGTFSGTGSINSLAAASVRGSRQNTALAKAAERMARDARQQIEQSPTPLLSARPPRAP